MTWYVARDGVEVATDASEAYGVSPAAGFGELSKVVSIGGDVVADSVVRVSVAVGLGELCEAVSIGDDVVADSAAAGVGDGATDEAFG